MADIKAMTLRQIMVYVKTVSDDLRARAAKSQQMRRR